MGCRSITGIDTRALVRRLRTGGAMRGVITTDASLTDEELLEAGSNSPSMSGRNLAAEVGATDCSEWTEGPEPMPVIPGSLGTGESRELPETPWRVVAIDCGAKRNIYRSLSQRGCQVIRMPWNSSPEDIRAQSPEGLFISNGPGDPAAVETLIKTLADVAGEVPTFGICLGHQLLALALGASTWKLPFGHRGANQPVRDMETGQVEITSQNHGFCVDWDSLESLDCQVTHVHLNDRTVAGFCHRSKPIFAVQYHPEASPGPHDAAHLFNRFVEMMARERAGQPQSSAGA